MDIGIAIVVLIWVVSSLIKGFKWLLRQTGTPPAPTPPMAPPRSQTPPAVRPPTFAQAPPPSRAPASRLEPRQPAAGGPAVASETNRRDLERQEQELFASEPAGLGGSLMPSSSPPPSPPNGLFHSTDDLVRAIILQEVLGPPLSRRAAPAAVPSSSTLPQ